MKTSDVLGIGIKAGILTFFGLVAYFLIMKALNLIYILEFRFLNFIILFAGILLTFKYIKSKIQDDLDYLKGLSLGFIITLSSVALFASFMFVYLNWIDPDFMEYLKENAWFGEYLSPLASNIGVILEGITSGAMVTFIVMQYLKKNEVKNEKSLQSNKEAGTSVNKT